MRPFSKSRCTLAIIAWNFEKHRFNVTVFLGCWTSMSKEVPFEGFDKRNLASVVSIVLLRMSGWLGLTDFGSSVEHFDDLCPYVGYPRGAS